MGLIGLNLTRLCPAIWLRALQNKGDKEWCSPIIILNTIITIPFFLSPLLLSFPLFSSPPFLKSTPTSHHQLIPALVFSPTPNEVVFNQPVKQQLHSPSLGCSPIGLEQASNLFPNHHLHSPYQHTGHIRGTQIQDSKWTHTHTHTHILCCDMTYRDRRVVHHRKHMELKTSKSTLSGSYQSCTQPHSTSQTGFTCIHRTHTHTLTRSHEHAEIGRASCRERV